MVLLAQKTEETKTIHVYVALCDNENQGIVPVPKQLGDGQDPKSNLYWGALYGMKTHFKRSAQWNLIKTLQSQNPHVLERVLFKHKNTETYLLADAYDGKYIKKTTIDFLKASSGDLQEKIDHSGKTLLFGGGAQLLAYIGHDGLMEFDLEESFKPCDGEERDAVILACISKEYFKPYLQLTKANPLVWSTGLMSPEVYTLEAAIEGWIANESDAQIRERAAQAYHKYQKCGIKGARNLLVTGY
ncbi:hypothetical protein POV27_01630 [Aureisphaera galaxeae]|uniref:hypothetical protein n=1 Tax=Aureisphaera galaxeae TaxID=1538023 RepID=UPI0023502005|nr:hypothetical protein [Aureisphaera galaxeae]MDC8002740.1 hypothetical protein [Aureisphaera galaxeae]